MHLDLSELSHLAPIFRELFKGYHVSRRDPELYAQLSNFQDQYRTLFKALGFELVCDTRGFYYFVPDTAVAAAQVNKTAQRLAENPHFIFADAQAKGYGVVEFTPSQLTATLRVVDDVARQDTRIETLATFTVQSGHPVIERV